MSPASPRPRRTRDRSRADERYLGRLRAALVRKRILITGASSGIGRELALQVADAGGRALLVARRADALERVADEMKQRGGSATTYSADLANPVMVDEFTRRVLRDEGPVDILVNNAGLSVRRPIAESELADFERMIAINYLGSVALTLGLLPGMLERGFGHIVQISTIGVQTGAPNFAAYVAAKAASDHFARTLGLELGGSGIHVTTLAIPLVRTPMLAPTRIYRAFPALAPEDAARRIGWAIVKRPVRVAPRWTTSLELLHAQCPGLMRWIFVRFHEPFHGWMRRRLARQEAAGLAQRGKPRAARSEPQASEDQQVGAQRGEAERRSDGIAERRSDGIDARRSDGIADRRSDGLERRQRIDE